jgi:hypothetical protein
MAIVACLAGGMGEFSLRDEDLVEETITVPLNTEKVKVQDILPEADDE